MPYSQLYTKKLKGKEVQLNEKSTQINELNSLKLSFVKLSPSENTTVLVTDYVDPHNYDYIANKIMSYTYLNAEQVGFIKKQKEKESIFKLEMPGGEFCGDGLLSAAALVKWMNYSGKNEFNLESSGINSSVQCSVKKIGNNIYRVKGSMPLEHQYIDFKTICKNRKVSGKLVMLPGISHLILEADQNKYEQKFIIELIKQVASEIEAKAIGIIPYRTTSKGIKIEPCIHVPKIGKLLFERGCGSGTLALGLYFAHELKKSINMSVKQPGGAINVEVNVLNLCNRENIKIENAFLETDILITCEGKVCI